MELISRECNPCSGGWPLLCFEKYKTQDGKEIHCSFYCGKGDPIPLAYAWIVNGKEKTKLSISKDRAPSELELLIAYDLHCQKEDN